MIARHCIRVVHRQDYVRRILGVLLGVLALNAFGGGMYGMLGAQSVPVEWLEGSPLQNYFIPSVFLFTCIGGLSLYAMFAVLRKKPHARFAAQGCATVLLIWLLAQIAVIGYTSWMQPATAIVAMLIGVLSLMLGSTQNLKQ